jgi:hypothetical protein
MKRTFMILAALACTITSAADAQNWKQTDTVSKTNRSMFRPLEDLPAPNEYRSASGAPGRRYWQQRVDYIIRATLDTAEHRLTGTERITYHNNSPDTLRFLWLQLDQNQVSVEHSRDRASKPALPQPQQGQTLSPQALAFLAPTFEGGHNITRVQTVTAQNALRDAKYLINGTQMRVDLPRGLPPGGVQQLEIDWNFLIPDAGRGAKERLANGYLYLMAQWFPRLAVYDDVNGWQNDQFMGQGEFYLEFGNYDVRLTVPRNHIVNATGRLVNPEVVLTPTQRQRLARALTSETPVFIVPADEVMTPGSRPAGTGMLTWHWRAENVRDFAFASSKLFVWDAAGFKYAGQTTPIEASSYYPREAMPLWDKVSTKAIIQTLKTYGRMSIEYPYPRATNVHGPIFGMEYPMVAFCGVRPNDGQYTEAMERALISVSIHEVGHNWFPMIIASDERKWTWMDEGLNSFLQYYSEQDWQRGYPSNRGPARNIVEYMKDPNQTPIMIHSDLINRRFGDHSYGKPAAGLVMLREHVLGPERFDVAFKDYSRNWAFKKPQPADFFRSMENGAGENMAWFWRGWFYTTHANDQAVTNVTTQNATELTGSATRGQFYHRITLKNEAGLVMPVHMVVTFADGTTQRINLPVEIWRFNENQFVHGFFSNKEITGVQLDPDEAFADINPANNVWRKGQPIS